jgi:ubiquinone/menaquinone biosynthesis C-methylase UbiE
MLKAGDAQQKAAATYDAAADCYDDRRNTFWERFGRRTIERLDLQPGQHVVDVCCGSGASALPAAKKVGPSGSVIGIDLSKKLLELARAKANQQQLHNVEFRVGDMLDLRLPESTFDAVVCVFGIFFVPDMVAAIRALWRLVRANGKLAITTWGPRFFEPATTSFWNSIREVRPDLYKGFNPWDRICEPAALLSLLRATGIENADVVAETGEHPTTTPEAWWSAVLGSGYRGTVEQLNSNQREQVRAANLNYVSESGIRAVEANVVYAIAAKCE